VWTGVRACDRSLEQLCCFFFSSRRRHTRLVSDWSSDVCSSDLNAGVTLHHNLPGGDYDHFARMAAQVTAAQADLRPATAAAEIRSEERRVGKEGRSRWAPSH